MTEAAIAVCTWGGSADGVPAEAAELLTLGRRAAAAFDAKLHWLVLGATPPETPELAARYGVTAVDRIDDAKLAGFRPDPSVEALAQYCAQRAPKLLLVAQSFDARLVAPRLAGRLAWAVVMNGVDVANAGDGRVEVTASAYGGDTRVVYRVGGSPCIVGVLANAVVAEPLADAAPTPALQDVSVDLDGVEERIRIAQSARTEGPRLEDAEVIV
ncbi:MAG: hypothetical protein JSU66_04825, partial [Deltaproteobacteria bacterium]